jgi:hypothetical protein
MIDRAWDEHADRHAARWAPTLPPCPTPASRLVQLRLLDEVSGRGRVHLPDDWSEDE